MDVERVLSERINMPQVMDVAAWAAEDRANRKRLWQCVRSSDRRTGVNALWVMTHLPESETEWIRALRDEMADMLLSETDGSRNRLLLEILREQDYEADEIRTDLLDYCLWKINSECEPYAVRCFSLYLAFKLCRHFPELLAELEEHLEMMTLQPLSPGLRSALRRTKRNIIRQRRKFL